MSLKNPNNSIGKRTRDVPACSAVPPPNSPTKEDVLACTVAISHFTAHNVILAVCHWKHSFSPQSLSYFIIPSRVVCSKSWVVLTSRPYVHLILNK